MHNKLHLKDIIYDNTTKLIILNKDVMNIAYKLKNKDDLFNLFIIGEMYHRYYDYYENYLNKNSKIIFTKTNMIETSYEFTSILDREDVPDNVFICEDVVRYSPNFFHSIYGEFDKNRIKNIMLYTELTNTEWLKETMLYNLLKLRT